MNSKVKVEANKQGQLISRSPNNPNWGWVRVTQDRNVLQEETGIITSIFCSALVQGRIKDLKNLGWVDGQELPGKIVFMDSITPFRKKDPEKDYKVAGRSNIVCSIDDAPIYRKYLYSADPNASDTLIQHDEVCRETIKGAYLAMEAEEESKFEL